MHSADFIHKDKYYIVKNIGVSLVSMNGIKLAAATVYDTIEAVCQMPQK